MFDWSNNISNAKSTSKKLFAIILYHYEASNVRKLSDRFFEAMFEDFKMIYEDENSTIVSKTLRSINFF